MSAPRPALRLAAALLALAAAAGAGYGLGQRHGTEPPAASPTPAAPAARKLLYYRNPMGLPDTSPVPKKDPMGMDYLPVYEGEADAEAAPGQVRLSPEKIQKLGVRTEAVTLRALDRSVDASGRVEPDERRVVAIAPKFEGFVERLHVSVTGQPVARGQALFEVYSPELVSAQREYALAAQGADSLKDAGPEAQKGLRQLADAALQRLRNWDIPDAQIRALTHSGEARRTLTFTSPAAGIVTEKKAVQGMRFMPGETLYQVTDLSAVWVVADVNEQDIGAVRPGSPVKLRVDAYPGETFDGRVSYIYPTLNADTRSVPVRIELANPGLRLKPAMFVHVSLPAGSAAPVLTVPSAAVLDSGTRRVVLVERGEGRFEPREVRLGARSARYVEVLDGVKADERVVVAANFLIDAESNLQAALGAFTATGGTPPAAQAASVVHRAEGQVDGADAAAGTVTLSHGPVASLNWPAMTMDFAVANPALQAALKPGARVAVDFVERKPGEWVITAVRPAAGR